jgi:hypothetical protein
VCAVGPEQYSKRACAIRIQHWCRNSGPCPSRDRRLKTTALSGQARTLRLYSELRFEEGEIDYLEVLAALAMRTGDGLQAMRLLTASGRLRGELGSPLPPVDELEQRIDAERDARLLIGDAEADRAERESAQTSLHDVVTEILEPRLASRRPASEPAGRCRSQRGQGRRRDLRAIRRNHGHE